MQVVIVGAGGHGKVVLDILRATRKYKPVAFIDADASLHGTRIGDVEVVGGPNQLPRLRQKKIRHAIVAIGDNLTRLQYAQMLRDAGFSLIRAIHPAASVTKSATIGENVVIAAGAVVCTEATIGDSAIINTNAGVDHETLVGCGAHVCPGVLLAGRVRVGEQAFIGLGAKVIQCLSIGDRATIGAGAVVLTDVPADATAVGVPARIVKTHAQAA
jgi:sugar O-acyltransferase (sialic acid O-acetyltransferase NeuD family)